MRQSLIYFLSILLLLFGFKSHAQVSQHEVQQFRFLSYLLRDAPPSVTEAKEFYSGKSLSEFKQTWVESTQFDSRLKRYFNDMFGVMNFVFLMSENHHLTQNDSGNYYLSIKGDCGNSNVVSVQPWWLESGNSINICSNSTSATQVFQDGQEEINCFRDGNEGIFHANCGCGPNLISCFPSSMIVSHLMPGPRFEFAERALYSYKNNLSWQDMLGGNSFIGSRFAYYPYIVSSFSARGDLYNTDDVQTLMNLPLEGSSSASFPASPAPRAGVVTSVGFLQKNNNFRSRIAKLTEVLLCQDVEPNLNTDGITQLVNPSFTQADHDHANKEGCSGCHMALDNLGSTLLGWDDIGIFRWWESPSQLGHVFGNRGTGPGFLMEGFVSQTEKFHSCMAKKIWEDFTGLKWSFAPEAVQSTLVSASADGPKSLVDTFVGLDILLSLRSTGLETSSSVKVELDFSQDVNPILTQSCSGSSCHSVGTTLGKRYEYVGQDSVFQEAPLSRISDGTMPPSSSGRTVLNTQREILSRFLQQTNP